MRHAEVFRFASQRVHLAFTRLTGGVHKTSTLSWIDDLDA